MHLPGSMQLLYQRTLVGREEEVVRCDVLAAVLQAAGECFGGGFHVSSHLRVQRAHQPRLVQGHQRQQVQRTSTLLQGR